jgi:hypothetical protein
MINRTIPLLFSLFLCNLTLAQEAQPLLPAAQKERNDAIRKASQVYADAKRAADAKYAKALKTDMAAAMKNRDLERANRLDREIHAIGDDSAPPRFDFRKAITGARYYGETKDFNVTEAVAKLATQNELDIPMQLWSVVHNDPKPGGGPKFFEVSFECGPYVVHFRTELPDDIAPKISVTPKAK